MSTRTHSADAVSTESDEVVAWRYDQLLASGFDAILAARLAGDRGFDLHALVGLVERGCAPALAARILAPLLDEAGPC